jgi:O-acetyl-ADP-ribose deacetylase (regulator of RNase III)
MTIVFEGIGDIFESNLQTLVNPVNTVGVMGKGLAEGFKTRYPEYYKDYQAACRRGHFRRNGGHIYTVDETRKIYSFPTKQHWRGKSKLDWIQHGLEWLAENREELGITELAIPAVGCGEGGLLWPDVHWLLHEYLEPMPIPVAIFVPFTAKKDE